jgi:DNA-binding PadR family transcriptional regulator
MTTEEIENMTPPPEGGPFRGLTAFQRDILWILKHRGASKGLSLLEALTHYYGEGVNHGRLYPNLDTLVEEGLVAKRQRDKRTNEYDLTRSGEHALEVRLQWERDGRDHS